MDRVLPGHAVDDEQPLDRAGGAIDLADLGHHFLVHVQAPGRVDDDDIVLGAAGMIDCGLRDLDGLIRRVDGLVVAGAVLLDAWTGELLDVVFE